MDLHNNPNMGTDLLEVKVKQLQDKIKELTQELGNVQNSVEAMTSDIQTNTLTASASVTTENLSASGDVTLGNVTADKIVTEDLEISNIDVDSVTSSESELGNASAEYMNVERGTSTDRMQVKSLLRGTPIASTQYVGYDEEGILIRVDPTIGIAKWETAPSRANEIRPVDNASVRIERSLTLDEALENVEEMDTDNLLGLDAGGKVVSKDTSTFLQKKLTAGYNIDIDEDTNTISCDMSEYFTKTETNNAISGAITELQNIPLLDNIDVVDISNEGTKKYLCTDISSASPMTPEWSLVTITVVKAKDPSSTVWVNQRCEGLGNNKEYIRQGFTTNGGTSFTWTAWEKLVTKNEQTMTYTGTADAYNGFGIPNFNGNEYIIDSIKTDEGYIVVPVYQNDGSVRLMIGNALQFPGFQQGNSLTVTISYHHR